MISHRSYMYLTSSLQDMLQLGLQPGLQPGYEEFTPNMDKPLITHFGPTKVITCVIPHLQGLWIVSDMSGHEAGRPVDF